MPIALGCRHQHANSSYPARLLRPPNRWPRRSSAANKCDEFPPLHCQTRPDELNPSVGNYRRRSKRSNVRSGSKTEPAALRRDVCFTPENGFWTAFPEVRLVPAADMGLYAELARTTRSPIRTVPGPVTTAYTPAQGNWPSLPTCTLFWLTRSEEFPYPWVDHPAQPLTSHTGGGRGLPRLSPSPHQAPARDQSTVFNEPRWFGFDDHVHAEPR